MRKFFYGFGLMLYILLSSAFVQPIELGHSAEISDTSDTKKGKKKKKKIATNSTGYNMVEAVSDKDMKIITKLIRNVVGDILRDIWLKRTAWK